jgi:hypothetical protein
MANRIREAMNINDPAPMGSAVTAVEADETDGPPRLGGEGAKSSLF